MHRIMQQAFAGRPVLGDVLQGADDAVDLAVATQHRLYPHAEAAIAAIVACDAHIGRHLAAAQLDQRVEGSAEAVAIIRVDAVKPALQTLATKLAEAEWSKVGIAAAIKETITAHGIKMPLLAMPVRALVCGRVQTPSVDSVLALFSKEIVIDRLRNS